MNDFRVTHPLGKGEVVSSILTGSTIKADEYRPFCMPKFSGRATHDATEHEHDTSTRGKSVESVRQAFSAWMKRAKLNRKTSDAASRVLMSLNACAEYPERLIFRLMLADDVAKLEQAITHSSRSAGPMKSTA